LQEVLGFFFLNFQKKTEAFAKHLISAPTFCGGETTAMAYSYAGVEAG